MNKRHLVKEDYFECEDPLDWFFTIKQWVFTYSDGTNEMITSRERRK